jgi:hypothetical protein
MGFVRCRHRGAIELIGEEPIPTLESLGAVADFVREVHGLLIYEQFLEAEGHERRRSSRVRGDGGLLAEPKVLRNKVDSRKETARDRALDFLLSSLLSPISCSDFYRFAAKKSGQQDAVRTFSGRRSGLGKSVTEAAR